MEFDFLLLIKALSISQSTEFQLFTIKSRHAAVKNNQIHHKSREPIP